MLEGIVYIARKLGWSRKEIGKLSPSQFNAILKELQRQEIQDEARKDYRVASLLAMMANCTQGKRVYQPKDFLRNEHPIEQTEYTNIMELARQKGIKIPKEVG